MPIRGSDVGGATETATNSEAAGHYADNPGSEKYEAEALKRCVIAPTLRKYPQQAKNVKTTSEFRRAKKRVALKAPARELPHTCAGHVIGDGVGGGR